MGVKKGIKESKAWKLYYFEKSKKWGVNPPAEYKGEKCKNEAYGMRTHQVRILIDMIEHGVHPDKAIEKVFEVTFR